MPIAGPTLFAQKIEVEKRISRNAFPSASLQWLVKEFPGLRKDKYYKEYHADTINYEAKFCWKKERYSVEFLKDGSLKDIEKQIKFTSIHSDIRQKITARLDSDFKRWKVSRCQEQQVSGIDLLRYEIEVKGSDQTGVVMFEYLFDEAGSLLEKQKILMPATLINQY